MILNKLLVSVLALCMLFGQLMETSIDRRGSVRSMLLYLSSRAPETTAETSGKPAAIQRITPLKMHVLSFTKLEPLPAYILACEDCTAITIVFSATCTSLAGCENLSVMDFSVTYESDYPTLFYGDEFPNPALQGENYAGIIYGMQEEFPVTSLEIGEITTGAVSYTVKSDACNFVLHYTYDYGKTDLSVPIVENNKQEQ